MGDQLWSQRCQAILHTSAAWDYHCVCDNRVTVCMTRFFSKHMQKGRHVLGLEFGIWNLGFGIWDLRSGGAAEVSSDGNWQVGDDAGKEKLRVSVVFLRSGGRGVCPWLMGLASQPQDIRQEEMIVDCGLWKKEKARLCSWFGI